MFIRIKKIKNKEYAYLVSNTWKKRKKAARQKVSSYLGKVYKLEKIKQQSLEEFLNLKNINNYLENTPHNKIVLDLIKLELSNHGFSEEKKGRWEKDDFVVHLRDKKVFSKQTRKNLALELNNNFLCSYTLRKLINFKPKEGLNELQIGKQLANYIEGAGITPPRSIFVKIAQKVLNQLKK